MRICYYSNGEQTFTWSRDAVADMARSWRESATREVPERARPFMDAHRRLDGTLAQAGLGPADVIVHDFDRHELRARWEDQKAVVAIDEIAEPARYTTCPGVH